MIVKFNSNLQLIPQKDSGKRGVLESIVRDAMRVVVTETGKIGGECLNGLGVFSVRELVLGKSMFLHVF